MTSKDFLLAELRALYAKIKKEMSEMELENRDARIRGDSYIARKPLQARIKAAQAALEDIAQKADRIKRDPLIEPDSGTVERHGLQNALRIDYLGGWGYKVVPSPDLTTLTS